MVLLGDLFKGVQESKVFGFVEVLNGMGKVFLLIIGLFIVLFVWYGVFFVFLVFCIILIVLIWIFIKEKKKEKELFLIGKYVKGFLSVFKYEGRWLFIVYLVGVICLFILFGILFYLLDVLEKIYDIDGVKKGLILVILFLVMCVMFYIIGSKIG